MEIGEGVRSEEDQRLGTRCCLEKDASSFGQIQFRSDLEVLGGSNEKETSGRELEGADKLSSLSHPSPRRLSFYTHHLN